ncbi:protein artemis [Leptopilina heterotoma]|uniref:protein artemis n=1 Tax=Leptopilina heterotoma TaxID=63436 RepID=UPI001CA93D34|nr:protein artemis [Leptopilina heterotoma]
MSTFAGPVEEIPGISVDCFANENLESSVYFLSHVHSDHMNGLDKYFVENLARYNKFLYCSEITKIVLTSKFDLTESTNIKSFSLSNPVIIEFKNRERKICYVTVTLIPAGHCPGSVMFLFEYNGKKILYTGDFRINSNDLSKIKSLHDYDGRNMYPLKFDKIYLDTTFLNLNYSNIPTRKESVEEIKKAASQWLEQDSKNVVLLKLPYTYGLEYVFREISIALKRKIHVLESVHDVYGQISEIAPYITGDGESTPLHACLSVGAYRKNKKCLPCRLDVDESNILLIHVSVLKWGGKLESNTITEWDELDKRQLSVCYSSHASCNELKSFLQYFLAKEIYPCVLPKNPQEHDRVYNLLSEFTKSKEHEIVSIVNHELNFLKSSSSTATFKSEIFTDSD